MKAVLRTLGILLLTNLIAFAQNAPPPTDEAIRESVRREAAKIELRKKLTDAQAAQKRGELAAANKYYEDCVALADKIGGAVPEPEQRELLAGLVATRLQLAEQALRRSEFAEADLHVGRVLKLDPRNEAALAFRQNCEKEKQRQAGTRPDQETIDRLPAAVKDRVQANTLAQDGKLLYEAGKLKDAEAKLKQALKLDPDNKAAFYYLELIKEQEFVRETKLQQEWSREKMLDITKEWNSPLKREALPTPNPYATTNLVHTSRARQVIYAKLDRIRLDVPVYEGVPLSSVISWLSDEAKKRDPDKRGINIILNANLEPVPTAPPAVDPATGLPVPGGGPAEPVDLSATTIRIVPGLTDVTLGQALDAIQKSADKPIKYSIEDYAVVFTPRTAETPMLYTRTFKVDPNTFMQGMQGVTTLDFGTGSGGGGGGGYGGGGRGGGGRSGGRGGGYGGGGGGYGGGGDYGSSGGSEYVGVSLAGGNRRGGGYGRGGGQQQQVVQQAAGGAGQLPGAAGGVDNLTVVTFQHQVINMVKAFFLAAGVDLAPPKQVFFNDRLGQLMVRATLQDLDTIEQAVQILNMAPPQLTLEAKFAEVSQDDTRSLGFDWFLGNTLIGGGRVGMQTGTAPSYGSPATSGTAANPSGIFPGPAPLDAAGNPILTPGFVFPSASDNFLTSGLRNSAPTLATITGILTDPQFRVAIRALEQRQGVDLLSAPKVTTLSSRQAQIKIVDVRYIVTDIETDQTSGGSTYNGYPGTAGGGGGGVGSLIQPIAEPYELGPVLDVVPYVSADGFTIQMTLIPTIKEFVGYDLDSAKLFSTQVQSVGATAANPLTQITPLPIFRLRQVVTSAIVWDGQTVVLGGLISENVSKTKDKVPLLGDLPLVGRLFRSESSQTRKKNLLIFVTPTIIDPAGNRVHTEEDLPFAQTSVPPQKPGVTQ